MFAFRKNPINNTKLYEDLMLTTDCSEDDIKKAYRNLAKECHPDKNKSPEAEKKFKDISHAYSILSDSKKKSLYDKFGDEGGNQNIDLGQFMNFDNIFDSFLNKSNPTNSPTSSKINLDISINLNITLEDVYWGKVFPYSYSRSLICSHCNGYGTPDIKNIITCDKCQGTGKIIKMNSMFPGMLAQTQIICNDCSGTGKQIKFGHHCQFCQGVGLETVKVNQNIRIDKGLNENHQIILEKGGNQDLKSKEIGDLSVKIIVDKHDLFDRKGNHLVIYQDVSLARALTNQNIYFKHLDQKSYHFLNEEIIYPNKIVVIKGFGFPILNTAQYGDLLIKFNVIFPEKLSDQRKYYLNKILPLDKPISGVKSSKSIENIVNLDSQQNSQLIEALNTDQLSDQKTSDKNNRSNFNFPHDQFATFDSPGECHTM